MVVNRSGGLPLGSGTHRGAQLCTADFGQKKAFTCPYHGWTYNLDGDLLGIIAGDKIYGEKMVRKEWGLRPLPRLATNRGMIFGFLNPDVVQPDPTWPGPGTAYPTTLSDGISREFYRYWLELVERGD